MIFHILEPYLWMPVNKKNPVVKLHFYCNNSKFQEVDIQLGGTDGDFYTTMDVSKYLGQDIEIRGEIPEDMFYNIFCCKEEVQNIYPFRPKIHFAPEIGLMIRMVLFMQTVFIISIISGIPMALFGEICTGDTL